MLAMFLFDSSTSTGNGNVNSQLWLLILVVVLLAALMFWSSWSNKKRQKKAQEINDRMKPGDKVMSIGGIMGEIVEIREDSFLIRSGDCLIELTRQAVNSMENFEVPQTSPAPDADAQPAGGEDEKTEEAKASVPTEGEEADQTAGEIPEESGEAASSEPGEGEVGH